MNAKQSAWPFLLLTLLCTAGAGCAGSATPEPPAETAASPDQEVLRALDYYDPIYRVDADGRVINFKLDGRYVPDEVMAQVGKLTELDGLGLWGATFSEESLVHLERLQKLRTLGIGATPLTDKALTHLAKLEGLRYVWLPRGPLSARAVDKLKKARPDLNVYLQ